MEELTKKVEVEQEHEDEIEFNNYEDIESLQDAIERERKAVKITSKILKFGLIFIAVFGLITLALNISCFCLSVKEDYALNHYEVYKTSIYDFYYGCGEDDCKYCNGKTSTSETDFVYYKTLTAIHTTLNNPKIACNVIFWILVIAYAIVLFFYLILQSQISNDNKELKKLKD